MAVHSHGSALLATLLLLRDSGTAEVPKSHPTSASEPAPPSRTSTDAGSVQPKGVGYSRGALGGCRARAPFTAGCLTLGSRGCGAPGVWQWLSVLRPQRLRARAVRIPRQRRERIVAKLGRKKKKRNRWNQLVPADQPQH